MRTVERDAKICAMRFAGFTYKECGKPFGLSVERTRQIIWRAKREKELESHHAELRKITPTGDTPVEYLELFIRVHNCRIMNSLQNSNITTLGQVVASLEDGSLLKKRHFGLRSFEELKRAIEECGFVK